MNGILLETQSDDLDIRIRRTPNGLITSGLILGDNSTQIAEHVLRANLGEFKEAPLIGAAIHKNINGTPDPFWIIQAEDILKSAGLPITKVTVTDNQITIQ